MSPRGYSVGPQQLIRSSKDNRRLAAELFGYYVLRMEAESKHSSERMFLPNLNVYLTCVFGLSFLFSGTVITALPRAVFGYALLKVTAAMGQVDLDFITRVTFWFYYGFFALVLGIFWLTMGLSPRIRLPEWERRYRLGHLFLSGANILGIMGVVAVVLHQRSLRYAITPNQIPYASLLDHQPINVAIAIMLICAPVGLFMVWSSRQRPEPD
jgi:hypothetical protein